MKEPKESIMRDEVVNKSIVKISLMLKIQTKQQKLSQKWKKRTNENFSQLIKTARI